MEKSESVKFRENLDWFLRIKMITPELHKQALERDIAHENSKISKNKHMAWIAINPPPLSISMEDLYHFSVKNIPYKNYLMCVEQNTDNGIRPHVHILAVVNSTCRPHAEISRLAKLYNVENNFVECKVSKNSLLNISRQNYIRGEKQQSKLLNVEKDIKDRLLVNIPNFYLNGIL